MQKSFVISEKIHRELVKLKMMERSKNIDSLIEKLIIEYRKQKFNEASDLFNKKLKGRKMAFNELLKKSKKIREEIGDEWFSE